MSKLFIFLIFIATTHSLASPFCMDNSKHGYTDDGFDYKKYYHVCCYCPCERYEHSYKRNRCENCMHFNVHPSEEKIPYLDESCE